MRSDEATTEVGLSFRGSRAMCAWVPFTPCQGDLLSPSRHLQILELPGQEPLQKSSKMRHIWGESFRKSPGRSAAAVGAHQEVFFRMSLAESVAGGRSLRFCCRCTGMRRIWRALRGATGNRGWESGLRTPRPSRCTSRARGTGSRTSVSSAPRMIRWRGCLPRARPPQRWSNVPAPAALAPMWAPGAASPAPRASPQAARLRYSRAAPASGAATCHGPAARA